MLSLNFYQLKVQAVIKETLILICVLWKSPVFIFIQPFDLVTKKTPFCRKCTTPKIPTPKNAEEKKSQLHVKEAN